MLDLTGKKALVTGATGGLGGAIARRLHAQGATVALSGTRVEALEALAKELGERAEITPCDLSNRDSVEALVPAAEARLGGLDILVNNAGVTRDNLFMRLKDEDWDLVLAVNLTAAFWCTQAVVPAMKRAGRGRIVSISSGAGLGVSLTGIQAYAAAKAGQIGLTRQLAHELGPFGITVNSIAPGFIRSNPTSERQWQAYGEEGQRRLLEATALKRLGAVEDIAHAVLFLASEFAGWITGQVLSVDGGK